MKETKFTEIALVQNIKLNTKAIASAINKTPSSSILDDTRSVTKTDVDVADYSQKPYGMEFFKKVKSSIRVFAKKYNHAELRVTNYCFIRMKKEDQVDYHSSFESNFVGIFLLEKSEKDHHVVFFNNEKAKDVKVDMKPGDLLLFPAHLLRKFPNLKTNKMYTYIVFDFHLDKPRMYEEE